jgi:hypothetical protein
MTLKAINGQSRSFLSSGFIWFRLQAKLDGIYQQCDIGNIRSDHLKGVVPASAFRECTGRCEHLLGGRQKHLQISNRHLAFLRGNRLGLAGVRRRGKFGPKAVLMAPETGRAMRGKGIEIAFAALAVVSAAALVASVAVFVLH